MDAGSWMTSTAAAQRLGVKPETLYAYVSRGLIRSEREPGTRRSRFLRADVERHAARSRGGRAGVMELVIETELTLLDPTGRLFYRGWPVEDAVERASFEEVATWLWSAERDPTPFVAPPSSLAVARKVVGRMGDLSPIDRWRTVLGPVRHADPLRADRRPSAVQITGRALIATLVDCLPVLGTAPDPEASVAARLWPRLTAAPPSARRVATIDAVLILLADHELAASTLAARIAASTWADPYLVVQAGLAVLGGPLHGGASETARKLLRDAGPKGASAAAAIGDLLGAGQRIPGFGHRVYESNDPRADVLLDRLRSMGDLPAAAQPILDVVRDRELPFPNVDFALACIGEAWDMVPGAMETAMATARIAGWLAHAAEEYRHALRFRTRAAYVGPKPS